MEQHFNQERTSQKDKILLPTLEYGLVLGLVSIVVSLILYFVGLQNNNWVRTIVSIVVNVIVLVWILKNYRDVKSNGLLSYGRGLGIGTLSFLWGGILVAIYTYLFFTVISPESIDYILEQQYQGMMEAGMSEDAALKMMEQTAFFTSPIFMSIVTVFAMPFWGFILSLIVSAIYKSDTPKT